MAGIRSRHVTKTRVEREEYVSSVIEPEPEPTAETIPSLDPTDALVEEAPKTSSPISTARSAKDWRVPSYFRDHWAEIFVTLFIAAAGYLFYTVAGLNREIGALNAKIDGQKTRLEDFKGVVDNVGKQLDRTEDRLNSFIDRASTLPTKARR